MLLKKYRNSDWLNQYYINVNLVLLLLLLLSLSHVLDKYEYYYSVLYIIMIKAAFTSRKHEKQCESRYCIRLKYTSIKCIMLPSIQVILNLHNDCAVLHNLCCHTTYSQYINYVYIK